MASRNDNYGGNPLLRMQRSIDSIAYGAETAGLFVELVIVEWNPPKENLPLKDVISFPEKLNYVSLRIITVPPEVHANFCAKFPLIEYIAKNTGIKRANGEFVLCTNPDNYFPLSFFQALAKEPLDIQSFYRADRYDVVFPDAAFDALPFSAKEYILTNTIVFAKVLQGYFPVQLGKPYPASCKANTTASHLLEKDVFFGPSGDFSLASRSVWLAIGGYKESVQTQVDIDNIGLLQMLALGLMPRIFTSPICAFHFDHLRPARRYNKLFLTYADDILKGKPIIPINDPGWGLDGISLEEYQIGGLSSNNSVKKIEIVFSNRIDPVFIPSLIERKRIVKRACSKLWRILYFIKRMVKYCLPYGFFR
jgi:hypothetical protein